VLGTQGAQAHVHASLRVRRPPMERPLQERPHSDFVVREAAKEAAGLKGTEERPGMCSDSRIASRVAAGASASPVEDPALFTSRAQPASCGYDFSCMLQSNTVT